MPELDADFEISNNNLEAEYEISEGQTFDCSFEIFASGTTWGAITGDIENQTDLQEQFATKADASTVETLSETVAENTGNITNIQNTIDTYGNIVTYNNTDFATAQQGSLADSALQPNDNVSELVNDAGYLVSSDLSDYATLNDLATKQDIIDDLTDIRNNASEGASAYSTIQNYGDIVTYNASNFATSTQGSKADTALQPNDNITELNNNAGYITSASLPTVNNSTVKFQKNGTDIETITLNQPSNTTVNFSIPTQASDINAVPISRTVNNKALSSNITLSSTDVSALPSSTTINDLTTTAQQNALNSGATSTNIGQITTNANDIADIKDLIPTQATATNQLADKSFVNSSIATNTANFIGTFQSVAELEAYSGTLTNNDYAFVETTDSAGNTLFDRYKYTTATTPASWQYEYELNNSSFTSNQWASINSGITSNDVTLIGTALQPNDNVSSLTNDAGYITSSSLPTVNNGTLTIQQNGTDVQTFAANQSSNVTANITVPTDTGDLTNGAGFITGITSGDVTTALGYTPYDNSNPNGYTSNVGTVTSVNNVSPVSGNVTISIPTDTSDLTNGAGYITGIGSSDVINALGYTPYNSTNPNGYTSNVGTVTSVNNTLPDANGNVTISVSGGANTDLSNLTATGEAHFQEPLVSGTNIKTINNTTLLGSGNIDTSEVFIAEKDVTTFQEVLNAYNAGKTIISKLKFNNDYKYFNLAIAYYPSSNSENPTVFVFRGSNVEDPTSIGSTQRQGIMTISVSSSGWTPSTYYVDYIAKAGIQAIGSSTVPVYVTSSGQITSTGLSIASSRFDGQWVGKYLEVSTATSAASREHDLSSYLPSDSYSYEVFVRIVLNKNSASNLAVGTVANPLTNRTGDNNNFCLYAYTMANSQYSFQSGILPIGTGRKLYSQISTASGTVGIYLHGYRRIGTNT